MSSSYWRTGELISLRALCVESQLSSTGYASGCESATAPMPIATSCGIVGRFASVFTMHHTITRDLESLQGKGTLTHAGCFIARCKYALAVSKRSLVIGPWRAASEYQCLVSTVGAFTTHSRRIARGDILTLHLDDSRKIDVLIDKADAANLTYGLLSTRQPQ